MRDFADHLARHFVHEHKSAAEVFCSASISMQVQPRRLLHITTCALPASILSEYLVESLDGILACGVRQTP